MRVLPARRLYVALAIGAMTIAVDPTAGFVLDALCLLLFAVDILAGRRVPAPEIVVSIPDRVALEESTAAALELTNRGPRRTTLRLVLDVSESLAAPRSMDVRTIELAPGERVRARIELLGKTRGEHEVGPLHVRILGPFGLAWRRVDRPARWSVQVIPGLREVRTQRLLAMHHQMHRLGIRHARRRGDGGAFESLREYARGDDPRHLDWKASARRGMLIVRQFEAERSQSVMLCIDTGRLMVERVAGKERLDCALASALVIGEVARVWNDLVGVFAFSDRVHVMLPPSRYSTSRLADVFARLESRPVEPDYPRAFARLSRMATRRSLLVFFSDVIDEEVSGVLATHLGRLARRHLPLFVAIRNTELFEAAEAPARDAQGVLRRAAAMELVLARTRTLARMREQGIRVADVFPGAAVSAAVNRYIAIKQRGAL